MPEITLSTDQMAQLNGLNEVVKVRDQSGRPVGRLVPDSLYRAMFEAWASSPITPEEIEAGRKTYRAEGGLSTAEAIAFIRRVAGEAAE
jgi:hypothetical protein